MALVAMPDESPAHYRRSRMLTAVEVLAVTAAYGAAAWYTPILMWRNR